MRWWSLGSDWTEAAAYAALEVTAARERLRVARERSRDRRRLAENAFAAGQDIFARGLWEAAEAHDATARGIEAALPSLERRCAQLRARVEQCAGAA